MRKGRTTRNRPPGPLRPSLRHCFPVHYCSRLFGIVQLKILPLSQCLLSVHSGNTAFYVLQESRNTVFPCSSGDSKESNPKPDQRVFHESRDTRHETRLLYFSHYGLLTSIPCLSGISHHFPAFPGYPPTRSRVRAPSAVLVRLHDERRWPQLPAHSGLVPLRRTQNEPMLRKTNVLDCANEEAFYMTLTPDRTALRAVLVNRYNRVAWISHHAARHGAAVRGKTVRTRRGSPGARLPCPLPLLTSGRPAMPGGPAACSGVRPGDDQAMGRTVYTPRRRP